MYHLHTMNTIRKKTSIVLYFQSIPFYTLNNFLNLNMQLKKYKTNKVQIETDDCFDSMKTIKVIEKTSSFIKIILLTFRPNLK